jgi:hypothetical protein
MLEMSDEELSVDASADKENTQYVITAIMR